MANENTQIPDLRQAQKGSILARHHAVEGNHAAQALGKSEAQAIGQGRALAETRQVDTFGMDVVIAARLLDSSDHVIFDQSFAVSITPTITRAAVLPLAQR